MIRTKIIATMGPACGDADAVFALLQAGADVFRLNFSHGDLDQHRQMLANIRKAEERFGHPVAVLGDLGGPKIRLGQVANHNETGGMPIGVGEDLTIQREPVVGENGRASSTYGHLVDDVQVGHRVFIEDGLLRFVCTDRSPDEIRCRCTAGGVLKSSKGINLPDTLVNVPSVTDKDWECVDWAIDNELDYLALSFVRTADDLKMIRWQLQRRHSRIHLVAKIEKAEALRVIDAIVDASDGLMIARGDLGVEMDVAQVPIIQKDLIRRCQSAAKPVIVATQMLQSMIETSSPTRAEVSDVANAIFDGTDSLMLSAETSVGKFPVQSVHMMNHVGEVTEHYLAGVSGSDGASVSAPRVGNDPAASALARGAWRIVQDLKARAVVIWSQTGSTARMFAKHHFPVPIAALSSDRYALRKMKLYYGVRPFEMPASPGDDMAGLIAKTDRLVRDRGLAKAGEPIVIVAGWSPATPNTMNGVIIHTVGEKWTPVSPHPAAGPQAAGATAGAEAR